MKDLVLKDEKNRLVFNIKQSYCNDSIVGEPFFSKYYIYFDYHKNLVIELISQGADVNKQNKKGYTPLIQG